MDDPVALPDRFTARPLTFDDLDAVFELIAACERAANGTSDIDPEDVRSDWSRPGFDLANAGRRRMDPAGGGRSDASTPRDRTLAPATRVRLVVGSR
jgi:hypothetical protein